MKSCLECKLKLPGKANEGSLFSQEVHGALCAPGILLYLPRAQRDMKLSCPGRDCGTFQCLQGKCCEAKLLGIRAGAADPADRSEHRNESCVFPWMGSESSPEQFLEDFISEESVAAAAENTTTELILGCSWWRVTETRGSFKMRWKLKYYTECDSVVTSFHPAAGPPVSHPLNIILPLNSIFFSLTLL